MTPVIMTLRRVHLRYRKAAAFFPVCLPYFLCVYFSFLFLSRPFLCYNFIFIPRARSPLDITRRGYRVAYRYALSRVYLPLKDTRRCVAPIVCPGISAHWSVNLGLPRNFYRKRARSARKRRARTSIFPLCLSCS